MFEVSYEKGDVYLLFHQMKLDYLTSALPSEMLPGVSLDSTPQCILGSVTPELAAYVLPGYVLPGIGLVHCCLHYDGSVADRNQYHTPTRLFFICLTALRLWKPIAIRIGGQFEVGNDEDLLRNPALFELTSVYQPDSSAEYSGSDVSAASETSSSCDHLLLTGLVHKIFSAAWLFRLVGST